MIGRKTIQRIPGIKTRWAAWVSQLLARHERWTDAQRLPFQLHVRLCRTPLLLYQRWLSFHTQVHPQLNLSIAACGVWNIATTDAYAPQMVFLQSIGSVIQKSLLLETKRRAQRSGVLPQQFEFRKAAPAPLKVDRPQLAMTLATARMRTEYLSSILHHNSWMRQESEFTQVSRRLTQRAQRVNEVSPVGPQMSLRKETMVTAASTRSASETMQEHSSFERKGSPQTVPAMVVPQLNVEQLANQVLKQIDRRVIARRERMGQV